MDSDLDFRFYDQQDLIIASIDSRLESDEKKLRRFIMENIIEDGSSYNLREKRELASRKCGLSLEELDRLYQDLAHKRVLVADDKDNVNFVYPVSALETNHRVRLADGRSFTAMCAIDSMGSHFTFKQAVRIDSVCSNTGQRVFLSLEEGRLVDYGPEDLHILHVDLNKKSDCSGDC